MMNVPESNPVEKRKSKNDLGLPEDKSILILQGAGINIQRGAEELLEAMTHLENCHLVIVGSGDVFPWLRKTVSENVTLRSRITIIDRVPYADMMQYTLNSDLGFSLDKDTNPNYRFSLPNKLFDYCKAGLPVVVSDLPEVARVVREAECGEVLQNHDPVRLAEAVRGLLRDESRMAAMRINSHKVMEKYNWEAQTKVLDEIYTGLL